MKVENKLEQSNKSKNVGSPLEIFLTWKNFQHITYVQKKNHHKSKTNSPNRLFLIPT
jgi:hypothetical protein